MAFLTGDAVELVALDPDDEIHVETYRRSRTEPSMRATGYYGGPMTAAEAREEIAARRDTDTPSALCGIRTDDTVAGWAAVWTIDQRARVVELAYYVLPAHQDNGYAGEAAGLLVEYAFEALNAHSVTAEVQANNEPSIRLLEGLGFQEVGRRREYFYKEGSYRDLTIWDLLADEFDPS